MPDPRFFADSPEAVGLDEQKVQALLDRAEREVRDGLLPAAQIAIARDGKIAAMRSFGRVRHGERVADATNDTLFHVFSCTKAITSALAWLLMQEGELDPAERVVDIVPEFVTHGKDGILVEQLLTHTAGFPRAPFPPTKFPDREARRARFRRWRLNWEPGTRFEYHATSSMYVVADIIERRTGRDYRELVRERIAAPLGLPDLWVGAPPAVHGRIADVEHVGEPISDEELAKLGLTRPPRTEVTPESLSRHNRPEVREAGIPGGGGTMTAGDLALFYQALLTGRAHDGREIWKTETLAMAREVRSGELKTPLGVLANRSLGLIIAGDERRNARGFGHTNSPLSFGHGGAGGQLGWADPQTGISLGYCTSGHDAHFVRAARRGVGISSRAAACLA